MNISFEIASDIFNFQLHRLKYDIQDKTFYLIQSIFIFLTKYNITITSKISKRTKKKKKKQILKIKIK